MYRELDDPPEYMPEYDRNQNRGNNQQPPYNQKHNKGNHQQANQNPQQRGGNNQNQRKSDDVLYKLVGVFRLDPETYDYVPLETYMAQGRGAVNGSMGIRLSQVKGYAFYEEGTLRLIQPGDPDYEFIHARVEAYEKTYRWLLHTVVPQYEVMIKSPQFNRLIKQVRSKKSGLTITQPSPRLSWFWKLSLVAIAILAIIVLVLLLSR